GASIGVALLFLRGEPEAELEVLEAAMVADDDFGDDGDPLDEGDGPEQFDEGEVKFEEIGGAEPDEQGTQSGQFGKAKSFRQAMVNAGLSPNESTELELALTGVLDFRRCRENDTFSVKRDAQGRLVHFEYHASAL